MIKTKLQRIMVPTDFSANAEKALFFAADITVKTNGILFLYNSYTPVAGPFIENRETRKEYNDATELEINRQLNLLKEKVLLQYKELTIQTFIGQSPLIDNIFNFAQSNEVDLIVIGTKGASGIKKAVIGSISAKIVQRSEIPVLLVPELEEWVAPQRIVFTSDYHPYDMDALKFTVAFSGLYNSQITFLHLIPKYLEDFLLEKERKEFEDHTSVLKNEFSGENIQFELLETRTPSKKIATLNEVISFDLLVMIPRKKSFFQYLLSESYTQNMAFITQKPLLIVPATS